MKIEASADMLFIFALSFTAFGLQGTVSGLKVHVEVVDNTFTLRTHNIVKEAVLYASRLLSIRVVARTPVFRVPRDKNACGLVYFDGPNAGKCGQISRDYTGTEQCGGARIPPAHLEGLQVFGRDEVQPLPTSLPEGRGFTDGTNFVVYLTSRESKLCAFSLAHSQVCRTEASVMGGVHSGRPVAGTINACWKEEETEDIMIRRVVIHELIHLLGMNFKSIWEFVECDGKGSARMCWQLRDVVRVTQEREVVVWSRHFRKVIRHKRICEGARQCQLSSDSPGCPPQGCDTYDGMILGNVTRSVKMFGGVVLAKSRTGVHWPEELFDNPTSIMVSMYVKAGYMMVDPLTLALLRTSGWYLVNHTVLPCMNHFLNSVSLSLSCSNLLENKTDSTCQNETLTGGNTNVQSSSQLSSPVNVSTGYTSVIPSVDVAGSEAYNSTTGLTKFAWDKQETKGLNVDGVSEDLKSNASHCSPLCDVVIIIQTVFLYIVLKVILKFFTLLVAGHVRPQTPGSPARSGGVNRTKNVFTLLCKALIEPAFLFNIAVKTFISRQAVS